MSTTEPGTELERREAILPVRAEILSDDEIRRLFRIAEGLALSRVYKDVTQAEQAFAKLIVGHELGLNVSQSMSIHFVEGNVQCHYSLLGLFVRARGYDFKYKTLTDELVEIDFYDREGEYIDTSKFSIEDAIKAKIVKRANDDTLTTMTGKSSNYDKYPRNMLIARAMSNGVRWFVQEATGGLPMYVEGEVPVTGELTEGEGDGSAPGIELGPKVDAVVERAQELGHAGLADRATVEITLGRRSPGYVNDWVTRASAELDALEQRQTDHVSEADVVEEPAADVPIDTSGLPEPPDDETTAARRAAIDQQLSVLYDRMADFDASADSADPDKAKQCGDEIAVLEAELRELGGDSPGQETMPV